MSVSTLVPWRSLIHGFTANATEYSNSAELCRCHIKFGPGDHNTEEGGPRQHTDMIVNKVLISPVLIASVILNVISGFLIINPAEFQQIGKIASSCPEQYYCPSD